MHRVVHIASDPVQEMGSSSVAKLFAIPFYVDLCQIGAVAIGPLMFSDVWHVPTFQRSNEYWDDVREGLIIGWLSPQSGCLKMRIYCGK